MELIEHQRHLRRVVATPLQETQHLRAQRERAAVEPVPLGVMLQARLGVIEGMLELMPQDRLALNRAHAGRAGRTPGRQRKSQHQRRPRPGRIAGLRPGQHLPAQQRGEQIGLGARQGLALQTGQVVEAREAPGIEVVAQRQRRAAELGALQPAPEFIQGRQSGLGRAGLFKEGHQTPELLALLLQVGLREHEHARQLGEQESRRASRTGLFDLWQGQDGQCSGLLRGHDRRAERHQRPSRPPAKGAAREADHRPAHASLPARAHCCPEPA